MTAARNPAVTPPVTRRAARAVAACLRRYERLLGGRPVVLAVSGGADSLALLLAFAALAPRRRPPVVVAHFSHGLRPRAAEREAALVAQAAARAGLPFIRGAPDVPAPHGASGVEAWARDARYRFLARVAVEHGGAAVVTGHTQDDQAETVLLRLIRGTGLRGLGAMREAAERTVDGAPVLVLRPLLGLRRAATEAVCAEARITPARDPSNRLLRFARNRVRRRVIPLLQSLNPQAVPAIARLGEHAQEDDALLLAEARRAVAGLEHRTATTVRWRRDLLRALPAPLFARVVQDAWEHLCGPGAALSGGHVSGMASLVRPTGGGALALPGDVRFIVEQRTVTLRRAQRTPRVPPEAALPVPGALTFGAWTVQAIACPLHEAPAPRPTRAVLDAGAVGGPLRVRVRRPGDRIHAAGMPGPVRVQDLMVNAKVPRAERSVMPLIEAPSGIVWVPGLRAARWARPQPATRRALVITVRRARSAGAED